MAKELKSKEHLLHGYQKKASDESYETKMYSEISQLYNSYIKFLYNFKLKSKLTSQITISVRDIEVKRAIQIEKLAGLTKSLHKSSKEFVIHVNGEHDYRLKSDQ